MAAQIMVWLKRHPWAITALLLFATLGYTRALDDRARAERTHQFCAYAYQKQVDARTDAIKGFRRIPPGPLRRKLVLVGITIHPRAELRADLQGKYGNRRLPPYCPQRNWPVTDKP